MLNNISKLIIPAMVFLVIIYGIFKKVNVYEVFVNGAKESFNMIMTIFPYILGMILAINIITSSGFLNIISYLFRWLFNILSFPDELFPLAIMRSLSGNGALAILNNILQNNGPDSYIGRLASVIQGSTDTTFYVLTLYFGSIGIKKIRYALWVGLFADVIGIISSVVIVKLLFL